MARQKNCFIIAVTPKLNRDGSPKEGYSAVYVGKVNPLKDTACSPWACVAGYKWTGQIEGGQLFLSDHAPAHIKAMAWPKRHYICKNEDVINFISEPGVTDITHRIPELAKANDFKDFIIAAWTTKEGKHCMAKLPGDARAKLIMHFIAKGEQCEVYFRPVVISEEKKYLVDFTISLKHSYQLSKSFKDNYFLHGENIWLRYEDPESCKGNNDADETV